MATEHLRPEWRYLQLARNEAGKFKPLHRDNGDGIDVDEIHDWAASGKPYGVRTGTPSGVVVVDIDPRNLPDGATVKSEYKRLGLPKTYRVKTPSGGLHVYLTAPADVLAATGRSHQFGPGVDFIGNWPYVVAPGVERFDGTYEPANAHPVAPMPEHLCEIVRDRVNSSAVRPVVPDVPKNPNPHPESVAYARACVADHVADLRALTALPECATHDLGPAGVHGWDQGFFLVAQRLVGIAMHPDNDVTLEEAEDLFTDNAPSGGGTFDPAHKWYDALRAPYRFALTTDEMFPLLSPEEVEAADASFPETDWRGDYLTRLTALEANGLKPAVPDAGPVMTDGRRFLYYGEVNGVFGDGGSGKSLFALAVCADALKNGGHAAYLDTDGCGLPFVRRTLQSFGVPAERVRDAFLYTDPSDAREFKAILTSIGTHWPRAVVVVDSVDASMSATGSGSPNDSEAVRRFYAPLARLATKGACVLTLDHIAKSTESAAYGASGSTAKKAAIGGAYLKLVTTAGQHFNRANGGKATLYLYKDRQGGLQEQGVDLKGEAAHFSISAPDANGVQAVEFTPASGATLTPLDVAETAILRASVAGQGIHTAWRAITAHPDYAAWQAQGLTNRGVRRALRRPHEPQTEETEHDDHEETTDEVLERRHARDGPSRRVY